jgi:AcrR family transcriptional regulator
MLPILTYLPTVVWTPRVALEVYAVHITVYCVHMVEMGTSERITAAALAILVEEGAHAVTMRRVAADAGVTTMATYRHYPNRETSLRSVADAAFSELGKAWGKRADTLDFEARFYGQMHDFLDFSLGKPNLYTFLITERREGTRHFPEDYGVDGSPAFGPVVEVVEQGMREGALRPDDPLEVALAVTMSTVGLVQLDLGGRMHLSEQGFRSLCERTVGRILNGFRP